MKNGNSVLMWTVLFCNVFSCLVMLGGCATSGDAEFARQMQIVDKVRQAAKENGVSWKAVIVSEGAPSVGEKLEFFFDTGVRLELHLQGNAQTEATEGDILPNEFPVGAIDVSEDE